MFAGRDRPSARPRRCCPRERRLPDRRLHEAAAGGGGPELGHGVLTHVLLRGLGEDGSPDAVGLGADAVTVQSLLQYANARVPELTLKYHGIKQYPVSFSTGMDFPLVVPGP